MTSIIIKNKNVDGVLGTRTWGGSLVGADESTELLTKFFGSLNWVTASMTSSSFPRLTGLVNAFTQSSKEKKDLLKIIRTSGQSYKHFMLVNYDSRVVIWGIFQSGMTLVVIYERKMFIRLATGH